MRRQSSGFAILLSLLLVLVLTIFGYWMLLLAETHYAATKLLYDSENARTISVAASMRLLVLHNSQQPRFFSDPLTWNGLQLSPFEFQQYRITGNLAAPWDPIGINLLNLQVRKARSFASRELPLRQLRFEDFALFSDTQQTLPASTLFDGKLFVRGGLALEQPARFRDAVHNEVSPEYYASYRKKNRFWFDFPTLEHLIVPQSFPAGFSITAKDPRFWRGDHYELRLDDLQVLRKANQWEVKYQGKSIGETETLLLSFDGNLQIIQTFREIEHLPSGKPEHSIYIASPEQIVIHGSVQSLQGNAYEHPLCILSDKSIQVRSDRNGVRIQACLISSGASSVRMDAGSVPLSDAEKSSWISEGRGSAMVLEPEKKAEFQQALDANRKFVWFRGSIGARGTVAIASDVGLVHFEACRKVHHLIPSFPFVYLVEGREKWL